MFSNPGWTSKGLLCYDHTPISSYCSRKFERKLKRDRLLQIERLTVILKEYTIKDDCSIFSSRSVSRKTCSENYEIL